MLKLVWGFISSLIYGENHVDELSLFKYRDDQNDGIEHPDAMPTELKVNYTIKI